MKHKILFIVLAFLTSGCSSKYLIKNHPLEGVKFSMEMPFIAFDNHTWYTGDSIPAASKGYFAINPSSRNYSFCSRPLRKEEKKGVNRIKNIVIIPPHEELTVKKYYEKPSSMFFLLYLEQVTRILLERPDGFQFFVSLYTFETMSDESIKSSWSKHKLTEENPFYDFYAKNKEFIKIKNQPTPERQEKLMSLLQENGGKAIAHKNYTEVNQQALANYYIKGCSAGLIPFQESWGRQKWQDNLYKK